MEADVSVPSSHDFKHSCNKFQLFAANGSPIQTFGEYLITVDLGLRRKFQWGFIFETVSNPIMVLIFGTIFLCWLNLKTVA